MPNLKVPDEYKLGLHRLLGLGANEREALLKALEDVEPTSDINKLKSQVVSKLTDISDSDEIVDGLLSLYGARVGFELPLDDFLNAISRAIEKSFDDAAQPPPPNTNEIKAILEKLLNVPTLAENMKAVQLLSEHRNTFFNARILTDIRPVFKTDIGDPLAFCLIIHTLKVSYFKGNQPTELFIAMDDNDIELLQDVLERAKKKGTRLKAILNAEDIKCMK